MKKMRVCGRCKRYTLEEGHCDLPTRAAHPAPFNPNDRYGNYRRQSQEIE